MIADQDQEGTRPRFLLLLLIKEVMNVRLLTSAATILKTRLLTSAATTTAYAVSADSTASSRSRRVNGLARVRLAPS